MELGRRPGSTRLPGESMSTVASSLHGRRSRQRPGWPRGKSTRGGWRESLPPGGARRRENFGSRIQLACTVGVTPTTQPGRPLAGAGEVTGFLGQPGIGAELEGGACGVAEADEMWRKLGRDVVQLRLPPARPHLRRCVPLSGPRAGAPTSLGYDAGCPRERGVSAHASSLGQCKQCSGEGHP